MEYTYSAFEPLYREWLADYFQEHPITDAEWMNARRTHTISGTEEMLALIAKICG